MTVTEAGSTVEKGDREKHLRWLKRAEHWGAWVACTEDDPVGEQTIWMMRHEKGRVRFYEKGKGQVGPEHPHIVAATYWAYANGFIDPACSFTHNMRARYEVEAGGVEQDFHPNRSDDGKGVDGG